jgi:hypothetical protein
MKNKRNVLYLASIAILIWSCTSCASRCKQQRRYWNNHRVVEVLKPQHSINRVYYE